MRSLSLFDLPFLSAAPAEQIYDDMESYSDGAALNGLNGGTGFAAAYVDRNGLFGVQAYDSMESYSDGAAVAGLNGGNGFSAAYVDRTI